MQHNSTSPHDRLQSEPAVRSMPTMVRAIRIRPRSTDPHCQEKTLTGEVRVNVRLTNAGDEAMVRRGFLAASKIRSVDVQAVIDTGAVRSVLPPAIVHKLGLAIARTEEVAYANDAAEQVEITEVVGIEIMDRRTTEETFVVGSEVLIGQISLESLDLVVDCHNRCVTPNPAHPDGPRFRV
jgi:clan AA aspartic protease